MISFDPTVAECVMCSRELGEYSPVFELERGYLCPDCLAAYLEELFPPLVHSRGRGPVCEHCRVRLRRGEEYREVFGHAVHTECLESWSARRFFPSNALEGRGFCNTYSYPSR